ncbi:MAG: hypothetical protein RL411_42, partial [Bacteroidota bacterium]
INLNYIYGVIKRWKNSILERTGPWVWFFLFYAVWGFFTLEDYGVHLDEITQRTIGMENNRFLSGRVGFDKVEQHKFFGPIWESMSYLAEQVVFTEPMRTKLLLRRALLWSFFVFGLWRLYLLGLRNNGWGMLRQLRWGAMLPVLMVALWPRMFAEAHYNTKDALFFVLVLLVVDGLDRVWRREKQRWDWGWFGVMGLLGVATTIRMGGVFVLGWAMLWPLFRSFKEKQSLDWDLIRWMIWGGVAFVAGYIGSYPYLWFTGWDGLVEVIGFAFNNPWQNGALFFGSMGPSRWYLLGWMVTTLSGLILLPLLLGAVVSVIQMVKGRLAFALSTANFLLLLLLSYIVFTFVKMPVMYDAWRHSLFLLLPVVVLSARGWVTLWFWALGSSLKQKALTFYTGIGLIQGVFFVVPDPFIALFDDFNRANEHTELGYESGQTYFNGLGHKLIKRYPMQVDYWHQTNYQALEWVGKQLPADASALVIGKGESLMLNAMLLPSALQWRIHTVTPEFLDSTVTLASINAIWPEVKAKLKEIPPKTSSNLAMSHERIPPIKQVYWIAFGDELQLKEPLEPTMYGVVSWELDQSFYRWKLPLLRIYRAVLKPTK